MNTKTLALAAAAVLAVTGCTQAQRVSDNLSIEAENFNVTRRGGGALG